MDSSVVEMVFWLIAAPAAAVGVVACLFRPPPVGMALRKGLFAWGRLRSARRRNRTGGSPHTHDQDYYWCRLLAVRAYAVDRQVTLARDATCVVTQGRITVDTAQGTCVGLESQALRTIRAQREYEEKRGYSYWVVLERVGSSLYDPAGDVALQCRDQQQSQELCEAIRSTTPIAATR